MSQNQENADENYYRENENFNPQDHENDPANDDLRITREELLEEGQELLDSLDSCPGEMRADELRRKAGAEIPSLIYPIFPKVGVACLAGSSDTGKSSLLRQLAVAVAAGDSEWLGFELRPEHRSAIYISTEDGEEAMSYLLRQQTQQYDDSELGRLRFLFTADDVLTTLQRNLARVPADLVVIDCFADVYIGDLKDTNKIRSFLLPFQQLAAEHRCLILFLHHTGKRTEGLIPHKNNLLAGQGLESKMRLVIELRADAVSPSERHLCIVKGNYLPLQYKTESFVLHFDGPQFTFSNTGLRLPFELLVRGQDTDDSKAKWEQAKDLRDQGMSYIKIADAMGYSSKTSIIKLFEKAKRLEWGKEDTEPDTAAA